MYRGETVATPFSRLRGEPVSEREIESALLTLQEFPGLTVFGTFRAGTQLGQTDLLVRVTDEDRFSITPAVAFFYMITGLHAAHIAGGLVAWVRVLNRLWRGAGTEAIRHGVELCTRYWHFLLIVWLVLFGLLFSGNDNLNILLTICGIR
jgi:cytochrome c oxidase subunit 3